MSAGRSAMAPSSWFHREASRWKNLTMGFASSAILPLGIFPGVETGGRGSHRDLLSAAGLLFEAANYLQRGLAADIEAETGLSQPWFETLVRLARIDPYGVRMNCMAARVSFAPSSFSRLIDRMEEAGLVERGADPTHRRATLVRLTSLGRRRAGEAMKAHEPSARARFAACLTVRELDALEVITRKIRDANQPDVDAKRSGSRT
ncbi:MAG: MarR family winged helix-turn-helix transcriptional regulator [Actinomycetota bacterium]|nr:MarR family winged helix-turn-helix transcriptional regulator [Actinomycetota bacterium]